MIKMFLIAALFIMEPALLHAQKIGSQEAASKAVINYSQAEELRIPTGLLADITVAPATGALYYVTDAVIDNSCTVGGGSKTVLCIYKGNGWAMVDDPYGYRSVLQVLSGVAAGDTNLETFTGTTIPDNQNTKQALQALETAVEVRNTSPTELNIFTSDDCSLVSGMIEGDLCFEY